MAGIGRGIVVFAFGTPATVGSNLLLAQIARQRAIEADAPVFTQKDIQFPSGPMLRKINVTYLEGEDFIGPPPTLLVAREAILWAKANDLDELLIIAAKPHMRRCVRDMVMAAKEMDYLAVLAHEPLINQSDEDSWFCLDSMKDKTSSKEKWLRRERIIESLPLWMYKLVAS